MSCLDILSTFPLLSMGIMNSEHYLVALSASHTWRSGGGQWRDREGFPTLASQHLTWPHWLEEEEKALSPGVLQQNYQFANKFVTWTILYSGHNCQFHCLSLKSASSPHFFVITLPPTNLLNLFLENLKQSINLKTLCEYIL